MGRIKVKWYTIAVILLVVVLCILSTLGHKWAHIAIAVLIVVFILITWTREIVIKIKEKRNSRS